MIQEDLWLSSYFPNKGAYKLTLPFNDSNLKSGFYYARVDAADTKNQYRLLSLGFRLVETSMKFRQQRQVERKRTNTCRLTHSNDQSQVVKIGEKAFTHSRFYQDNKVGTSTASRIKHDWLLSYYSGQRGSAMIVAEENNEISGFLLLIDQTIDLIATSENHRGKGVASDLIGFANEKFGFLDAGTQSTNIPSIQMYISNGFVLSQTQYVFHLHQ